MVSGGEARDALTAASGGGRPVMDDRQHHDFIVLHLFNLPKIPLHTFLALDLAFIEGVEVVPQGVGGAFRFGSSSSRTLRLVR